MNLSSSLKALALTAATIGIFSEAGQASARVTEFQPTGLDTIQLAQTFGNTPINENNFLVVAVPGAAAQPYRLFIVEQMASSPTCWSLVDPSVMPTAVNDLWNSFDYSGICRLQKDSNGYAVWAGEDIGPGGIFELRERNGEILLQYRTSLTGRDRFTIGRTGGISPTGYTKIHLDPGWSLTKRTFEGQIVGSNLVYFTHDMTVAQLLAAEDGDVATGPSEPSQPSQPTPPATLPFTDISGNIYANEIVQAAQLGLVSGFAEDGTFRPRNSLTREQGVSIVMEAASQVLPTSMLANIPQAVFSAPFPDVAQDRWSALKIAQAKSLDIVAGDFGTGNFRPTDNLSRAEYMAMLNKLARLSELAKASDAEGATPLPQDATTLLPNIPNPPTFSDISGHWGEAVITEMAGWCRVATPVNETGTSFAPEADILRDYAAAASVRLVDCPAARTGGGV
jgi:N-acetylmuramoyl-L-alanine amidase